MKYLPLFFLTLILFTGNLLSQPVLVDKIIGVVGDKVILHSELEVQFLQYQQQGEVPEGFRCQILEQMLIQRMMITQAEADSIVIEEVDVEGELERRFRYFISLFGSQEELEKYYGKSIIELKEEFRTDVREQLLSQRMQSKITGELKVTPGEVKRFFNAIPADSLPYLNAEVEVGQLILMAKASKANKDASLKAITDLHKRALAGEDFALLAILYSKDEATRASGGELPEFTRSDGYVREFTGAAFKLAKVGEISDVVETQFGYHILQLIDRKGDRVKVRHILISPRITGDDIKLTKLRADSIRTQILNKEITWAEAVKRYSDDEATNENGGMFFNQQNNNNYYQIDQLGELDRDIPFIIDGLKPGEISSPVHYKDQRENEGYRIIYLRSELPPHIANLEDDYTRIQALALVEKKQKALMDWLKEKISRTYTRVDETYRDCPEMDVWFQKPIKQMNKFTSEVEAINALTATYKNVSNEISKVIVGQDDVVRLVLISILSDGHSLLVGVPGLAKTLLVKTIADVLDLSFKRIQFTPDLMPSDITGSEILDENRRFVFLKGPLFANIVLADEINRTPPKTQAALLEAMQERSVTTAGFLHKVPLPFFVLATQNPIEQEGTYPLPEAQLDRFMFHISVDYPTFQEEIDVVKQTTTDRKVDLVKHLNAEEIIYYQKLIRQVPVADNVMEYAVNLATKTRPGTAKAPANVTEYLAWGAGPRASQFLVMGAKCHAVLNGKYSPDIEDVRAVAPPILRHRIVRNYKAEAEGVTMDTIITSLF